MLEQTGPSHAADGSSGLRAKRAVDSAPVLGDLPDLLLVERTRSRDARAFETLMRRYNRRLFRITRSILSNEDAAEEAARAAYIRAFTNLDRYEPAGKFGAWLARLAFNEALASRKQSSGSAPVSPAAQNPLGAPRADELNPPQSQSVAVPGPDANVSGVPSRQMLESAIDALPEVFRTVFVLRVIEDLSGVEVAVCLGLNETTVRTRLYRAQQRLKMDAARMLRAAPFNIFELTAERSDRIVNQVLARWQVAAPPVEAR